MPLRSAFGFRRDCQDTDWVLILSRLRSSRPCVRTPRSTPPRASRTLLEQVGSSKSKQSCPYEGCQMLFQHSSQLVIHLRSHTRVRSTSAARPSVSWGTYAHPSAVMSDSGPTASAHPRTRVAAPRSTSVFNCCRVQTHGPNGRQVMQGKGFTIGQPQEAHGKPAG